MIDTTCNTRTLHFARTNYKVNFQFVQIQSDTPPVLSYQAPGTFGEQGDGRQYSFLMYAQPRNIELDTLTIPGEGEAFDVEKFQADNGFRDANAGRGMIVQLGGEANCDGAPARPPPAQSLAPAPEEPEETPEPRPQPPSPPVQSPPQNPPVQEEPETSEAPEVPQATPSSPPVAPPRVTPVVPTPPTEEPETPQTPESPQTPAVPGSTQAPQQTQVPDEEGSPTTAPVAVPTTDLAVVSSVVRNGTLPSTLVTSPDSDLTGSQTTSGGPLQQTDNGASGLSLNMASCVMLVSLAVLGSFLA
jgi:hypothetical protein